MAKFVTFFYVYPKLSGGLQFSNLRIYSDSLVASNYQWQKFVTALACDFLQCLKSLLGRIRQQQ
jgi:hypothetical protein